MESLSIYNFLETEDIAFKVCLFDKKTRDLIKENCLKGLMNQGISKRSLTLKTDGSYHDPDQLSEYTQNLVHSFNWSLSEKEHLIQSTAEKLQKTLYMHGRNSVAYIGKEEDGFVAFKPHESEVNIGKA